MYFEKGQHVDEMHGHEPSSMHGTLKAFGYRPVAIIEIDEMQAMALAGNAGLPELRRLGNKQAYVMASNEDQVIVLYFYDSAFFLTTLVTSTPQG